MVKKQTFEELGASQKFSVVIGIGAGLVTLAQNFFVGTLSVGLEQNITRSPINGWTLGLGILVLVLAVQLIRKK